ncbi:TonB-dependent receptor [Sphingomonas naphthae]|uniref:TonB-dependent receptor n=1 Tax=Sphingomonas naphthae TaxID=1813468 RepID=A0ABY7TLM8_9SPHN|nr:TonB-dependent receptor [Sphingomonas naphthae]WCT74074.1 TonB-dependent receptor [Sphingomonas naphthae]
MTTAATAWRLALLGCTTLATSPLMAQTAAPPATAGRPGGSVQPATPPQTRPEQLPEAEAPVDISTAGAGGSDGGEIIVRGRYIPQPVRATPQVISVLSTADIARAGDGDIASALGRVTGLTVAGNGFVYVRGLGDRYSLALLNGLPLPSPEPLKRTVPLDLFPTSVIASAVVQKSFSANYPGEFGGGVINLTTPSVPKEAYLTIGGGVTWDSETTSKLGYTYYGSNTDWLGYDGGTRKTPGALKDAFLSTRALTPGNYTNAQLQGFAASLSNASTTLLQRNFNIPANFSGDLSFGASKEVGDINLGVFGAAGLSNSWRTRDIRQQVSNDPQLASLQRDQQTVITDNRIVANGLLGFGAEFGPHKIRLTNLYIHDTVKQGRLSAGYNANVGGADPIANPDFYGTPPILTQNTNWFERQLFVTQAVGEYKFGDLSLNLRGSYANTKRKAPYERTFGYTYSTAARDYVNSVSNVAGQSAQIAFSDLNENSYAGAGDFGYKLPTALEWRISGGYSYNRNSRTSYRYVFDYVSGSGALPLNASQQRPDFLVSDYNIYTYNIRLIDASGSQGTAAYDAGLTVHAGYGQIEGELAKGLRIAAGVRYEDGKQSVQPQGAGFAATLIKADYWLPGATITWNFADDMQFRLSASKTIARPQFRELAYQIYQDYESDRAFTGNPFLTDSKLWNADARYEYFMGRDQIIAAAAFFKRLDNPIEQVAFLAGGGALRTGFANAPKADLYGGEIEATHYFDLSGMGGDLLAARKLRVSANYTYTQSKLKVASGNVVGPDLTVVAASALFRDGAPLTGQSDHIANAQIGIESSDHLSQQTILLNYASPRVSNRGPIQGTGRQPDIFEKPGFTLDFVAREEINLFTPIEIKFEARNLTGRKVVEYQKTDTTRIFVNRYQLGRTFSLSASVKF